MSLRKYKRYRDRVMWVILSVALPFIVCSRQPAEHLDVERQQVLAKYFSPQLISQWQADAERINRQFGVNIFSSCQYGKYFLVGKVDLGEVFDARLENNRQAFLRFAETRALIRQTSSCERYSRYAKAAVRFLDYFGYHSVLYYPDEFHPLFTHQKDCWLFIYEPVEQAKPDEVHYSFRADARRLVVYGGANMTPAQSEDHCLFYIPQDSYQPYRSITMFPFFGHQDSSRLNVYAVNPPTVEQVARRDSAHLAPSVFSNKTIQVGRWISMEKVYRELRNGFSFTAEDSVYTWSAMGFYGLPLDSTLWKSPDHQ